MVLGIDAVGGERVDESPSGRAEGDDPPAPPAAQTGPGDELSDDALAAVVGGVSLEAALARAAAFSAAASASGITTGASSRTA